ncbi:MAG: ABC transporter substrate-binding protein [Sphingomonadaceae bacterium]
MKDMLDIKRIVLALAAAGLVLAVAGCGPQAAPKESLSLKVGVLPIVDVLPMYVAEQEGYFKEQNVEVEMVLFPSALERDSAFVAGQIDGELNDPISAALLNKEGDKARIVRLAYKGNESMAMMVVLLSPSSKITSPKDLKGVPIGISKNSVIEYSTDRLLQSAGLAASEIEKTEVTKIPVRAEMLAKGQLQAATLPEPLASLAQQQGARRLIDDSKTGIGQSVITFRQEVVSKNAEAIRRYLAAYEKAVEAINGSPNKYRDLMVDKAKVPDSLKESFDVPQFAKGQLIAQRDLEDVMQWMVERKLLEKAIPYDQMVAQGLLPK